MIAHTPGQKFASLSLDTKNQTTESLHALINHLVGLGGCRACGRIAVLNVQYAVDPGPELPGVISITHQGLG